VVNVVTWWMHDWQAGEESGSSAKRSSLLSTAMALAGAAMVAGAVAGSAEAALQKVEGTEREEQDAVTTGIREPSNLGSGKGNTVREGAKTNSQVTPPPSKQQIPLKHEIHTSNPLYHL
jgi:hypothetical protein